MEQEVVLGPEGSECKSDEVAALVKRLPMKLRVGMRAEVLSAALQEGLLSAADEGHWLWLLPSKTLLAYFCGRIWCGDMALYNPRVKAYLWQGGNGRFPQKDLTGLFGVHNLRTLRGQRILEPLPAGWELVERIFEKNTKVTEK